MNKEQAIDLLDNLIGMIEDNQDNDYDTAFRMAIDALKAQLSQEGTTFDTISRQAALDALARTAREKFNLSDEYNHYLAGLMDGELAIKELPTIQPEHKVRFADKDHVWIDGKQYISLPRFQEAVKEASYEPQWIPCSERMPEEHEWTGTKKFGTTISDEVHVTFENEKGERFCKYLSFQNGELSRYDKLLMETWFKGSKPIAWMPFPKPFDGGTA